MFGKLIPTLSLILSCGFVAGNLRAQEVSVESLPPSVVITSPRAGDITVDAAAVKTISITFSKKMASQSFSLVQMSAESFPKLEGQPKFSADGLTCEVAVKLEPAKTYVLWVNSQKYAGFKDLSGKSAVPYLLVFQTK
jgi:hypothetical protein